MKRYEFLRPDLHLHSHCSDGTDSPAELLQKVRATNVDFFSLTDHDTVQGCETVISQLQVGDPAFVRGVEFSCEDAEGKYHVLGYGFDPSLPAVDDLASYGHALRMEKAENRFRFLQERYGFCFPEEEKQELFSMQNPGRPHFVSMLLRHGFIRHKEDGFALLRNCPDSETHISPETAIDSILRSDGIPVLAHGILADGSRSLNREEITRRVQRLKEAGLWGLECFYSTYSPEQHEIMLALATDHDLFITAGSDYHGTNKSIKIGETNIDNTEWLQPFFDAVFDRIIVKD